MNYGGFEVVGSLLQGPQGASGKARRIGEKNADYFVELQYLDPIAAPGQERVVVEQFLERAQLQQSVRSDYWETVHEIGEVEDGAFRVSDLYQRSAQALIDGRVRLASADLQNIVSSCLLGLKDFQEQSSGRAHGQLRAEDVLIDDHLGPGRWRVVLSRPSTATQSGESLEKARRADAQAIGGIVLGLVEHRQPRPLPSRVQVNEAWKRVGQSQAGSWVTAVNRLLDPDLDPSSDWLNEAIAEFRSLKTKSGKRSRWPLVAAVVGIAMIGGGVFTAGTLGGWWNKTEPDTEPLTLAAWQSWIRNCDWVVRLRRELDRAYPEATRDENASKTRSLLNELIAALPTSADYRNLPKGAENAWTPHLLIPNPTNTVGGLFESNEDGRVVDENGRFVPDAVHFEHFYEIKNIHRRVQVVQEVVESIEKICQESGNRGDVESFVKTLGAWGAQPEQLKSLEAVPQQLVIDEITGTDSIINFVAAVELSAQARTLETDLSLLVERCAALKSHADESAANDPVLGRLDSIVQAEIVRSVADGQDAATTIVAIKDAAGGANEVLDRIERLMNDHYTQIVQRPFVQALNDRGLSSKNEFSVLEDWLEVAGQLRFRRLTGARDLFRSLRSPDGITAFLSTANESIEQVQALPQAATDDRVQSAIQRLQSTMAEIRTEIDSALELEATVANESELNARFSSIDSRLQSDVKDIAATVVSENSRTLAQAIDLFVSTTSPFRDNSLFDQEIRKLRDRLEIEAREGQSLQTDAEQSALAFRLVQEHDAVRDRFIAIRDHTSVQFNIERTESIDIDPLRVAFEALRHSRRLALIGSSDEISATPDDVLTAVASEIEAAIGQARALENRLNQWVDVAQLSEVASVLNPTLSDNTEVAQAYGEAIAALRGRVTNATDVQGNQTDLLATASDPRSPAELRRAAFQRVMSSGSDWPATPDDLTAFIDCGTSLIASLQRATDHAWDVQVVQDAIGERWRVAMSNAATETDFVAIRGLRDSAGLDGSAETALSSEIRRNLAVVDLKAALAALPRLNDSQADDAEVRRTVDGWLQQHEPVINNAAWLGELRSAFNDTSQSSGEFDPGAYGPGTTNTGWVGSVDAELNTISYRKGGWTLEFRRVTTGDTEDVWFLGTEEVPLGLLLETVPHDQLQVDHAEGRKTNGPRGWDVDDAGNVLSSTSWFEYQTSPLDRSSSIGDFNQFGLYSPDLSQAGASAILNQSDGALKDDFPAQNFMLETIEYFCAQTGCVLPSEEVWLAAVTEQFAQAGLGSPQVNGASVSALALQVRDAQWLNQYQYTEQLRADGNLQPGHDFWWKFCVFPWQRGADASSVWTGVDDQHLLFVPVSHGNANGWKHLIGNVGEVVTVAGGHAAIGGSAMSPASVPVTTPIALRRSHLPAADIGFRLAMKVPASDLNPSLRKRVEGLLANDKTPAQFPSR